MTRQSLSPSSPYPPPSSNSYSSSMGETTQYQEDETTALLSIPNSSISETATASINNNEHNCMDGEGISSYGTIGSNSIGSNSIGGSSDINTTNNVNDRNLSEAGGLDFVDIEEGNSERQHQQQHHEGTNTAVNNNDGEQSSEEEEPRDGVIGNLTRRLRCLFSTITWPIVPLGTIVSVALLWVLYAASSLDLRKSCSHPMHSYALISLILVSYIPNHSHVRSQLFHYLRERDGPIRPAR